MGWFLRAYARRLIFAVVIMLGMAGAGLITLFLGQPVASLMGLDKDGKMWVLFVLFFIVVGTAGWLADKMRR